MYIIQYKTSEEWHMAREVDSIIPYTACKFSRTNMANLYWSSSFKKIIKTSKPLILIGGCKSEPTYNKFKAEYHMYKEKHFIKFYKCRVKNTSSVTLKPQMVDIIQILVSRTITCSFCVRNNLLSPVLLFTLLVLMQ